MLHMVSNLSDKDPFHIQNCRPSPLALCEVDHNDYMRYTQSKHAAVFACAQGASSTLR